MMIFPYLQTSWFFTTTERERLSNFPPVLNWGISRCPYGEILGAGIAWNDYS